MNGIASCGGSGVPDRSGGCGAVTKPMLVTSATTTRVLGWIKMSAVPPTTLPVWPATGPTGDLPSSKPSP